MDMALPKTRSSGLSPFRKLLFKLSTEIISEELKDMKFVCGDRITKEKLEAITDPSAFFEVLMEKDELAEDNLDFLLEILSTIGRDDLVTNTQKFKEGLNAVDLPDQLARSAPADMDQQQSHSASMTHAASSGDMTAGSGLQQQYPGMEAEGCRANGPGLHPVGQGIIRARSADSRVGPEGSSLVETVHTAPVTADPPSLNWKNPPSHDATSSTRASDSSRSNMAARCHHPGSQNEEEEIDTEIKKPYSGGVDFLRRLQPDAADAEKRPSPQLVHLPPGFAMLPVATIQTDNAEDPSSRSATGEPSLHVGEVTPPTGSNISDLYFPEPESVSPQPSTTYVKVPPAVGGNRSQYDATRGENPDGSLNLRLHSSIASSGATALEHVAEPDTEFSQTAVKQLMIASRVTEDDSTTYPKVPLDSNLVTQKLLAEKQHKRELLELELRQKPKKPTTEEEVKLYSYQVELAEPGLRGDNCIICAPTGSGKTITAGYICKFRYDRAKQDGRKFTALFIVCIRNIIIQQKDALWRVCGNSPTVEGIQDTSNLKEMIDEHGVVVLTAQIFVNALKAKELCISDLDLIILDECHHTDSSHPYNVIMQLYHGARREDTGVALPQVIGLTASLGVGAEKEDALKHYILLCANLDTTLITHVRNEENMSKLFEHNPFPKKDQISAVRGRDQNDMIALILNTLMKKIEERTPLASLRPPNRGSQQYENWIVDQRMDAEQNHNQDAIFGSQALQKLNTALVAYDELQARDVLSLLTTFFQDSPVSMELQGFETDIRELFDTHYEILLEHSESEALMDNPKLDKLTNLLIDLYQSNPDSRGILLTRTRFNVNCLVAFIDRQEQLKTVVLPGKFVGQGGQEGTMTDVDQERTLRMFRADKDEPKRINLLVATDVAQEGLDMPKCNFVIRYNFVSNEIGTVQSRGRARAKHSECYLIVNRGSINERRELENLEKEYLMMQALTDIDNVDQVELELKIRQKQAELWQQHQIQQERKRQNASLISPGCITVHCKHCKTFLCQGTAMRNKGSNYIVVDEAFPARVECRRHEKSREFRYDSHIGYVSCAKESCGRRLGPQIHYKQGRREYGYALSKDSVMWQYAGEEDYRQIKQWSKVPFNIEEENLLE